MFFFKHLHITILVNTLFESRSILHPFLTIQTGTPQFLFPLFPGIGTGVEEGCCPKAGSLLWRSETEQ